MNNAYIRAQQCKVKEAKFPFVKIGTQYWTTKNLSLSVTPMGNTIPEMQANGNVEKITQPINLLTGGFATSNATIVDANNFTTNNINGHVNKAVTTAGKWIKVIANITISSGNCTIKFIGGVNSKTFTTSINETFYIQADGSVMAVLASNSGVNVNIISFSIQEIGWSGSQELYDGIYAQTAGTVEQKTYAAVKAAAMWCNYNNDAPTGLIYGKLYNWFAVKLFQMDIDYYNAANPDKKWANGFRMPTQTEFQTLSTYLGGDAVSGGHLKEAGLAHWNSPNTGADNSSGFCALPCGLKGTDGSFANLGNGSRIWDLDKSRIALDWNSSVLTIGSPSSIYGFSIRLIKA